jgi:hypothetical protein
MGLRREFLAVIRVINCRDVIHRFERPAPRAGLGTRDPEGTGSGHTARRTMPGEIRTTGIAAALSALFGAGASERPATRPIAPATRPPAPAK